MLVGNGVTVKLVVTGALFTVTVNDTQKPTISCPSSVTATYDPATCGRIVNGLAPTASDNCAVSKVQFVLTGATTGSGNNDASGTNFQLGVTTVTYVVTDVNGNTNSCSFTVTVTPAPVTTSLTVTPLPTSINYQYSDRAVFIATISSTASPAVDLASSCGAKAADSVRFYVGTQLMGTVPMVPSGSTLVGTLTKELLETVVGAMDPNVNPKSVTAVFVNPNSTYYSGVVNPAAQSINMAKEDARITYTGSVFVGTSSATSTTANVTLAATISDISITTDAGSDSYPGDIRKAKARFLKDGSPIVVSGVTDANGWMTPGLVTPGVLTQGVIVLTTPFTISGGNSDQWQISVEVGGPGYYTRLSADDDVILTVYQPVGDFITGGGCIMPNNSTGQYAASPNHRMNFGFSVKYNKAGTNLQGKLNAIYRRDYPDGVHNFQIKSSKTTSLSVNVNDPNRKIAIASGVAQLTDVTTGIVYAGNNATFTYTVIDHGEPGNLDSFGLVLYSNQGALLFASNWVGNANQPMMLCGGNMIINGSGVGSAIAARLGDVQKDDVTLNEKPKPLYEGNLDVKVMPNPSETYFTLLLQSSNTTEGITLKIVDQNGRLVEVKNSLQAGQAVQVGGTYRQGVYFVQAVQGDKRKVVRLLKL